MTWQEKAQNATLVLALAAKGQAIQERLLRYRVENARPEDKQRGKPLPAEEAASHAGISHRQWQRWEAGETVPHIKSLKEAAAELEIPLAEFLPPDERKRGATPDALAALDGNRPDDDLYSELQEIKKIVTTLGQVLDEMGRQNESRAERFETKLEAIRRALDRRYRQAG